MNQLKQMLAVASCLIAVPFALFADEVTLSSPDGKTSITGELLSFDDTTYVLDTSIGELRLSRVWTICEGEACPEPIAEFELAILANGPETNDLLQDLIKGFASTQDLIGSPVVDATGAASSIELLDSAGTEIEGNVDITVQVIGTGFEELRSGAADMYLSTTAVPSDIADQAVLAGQPDPRGQGRERVIALDALVPIVHPSNPARAVSLEALSQIAAGRIKNWSEIGGNDAPIRMILPAEGSTLASTFGELVLEPNRVRLRRTSERAENEIQAAAAVVADVNAITITSRSGSGAAEVLPIRQACGPLAYANDFSIKAEEYPLSHRVYTYTSGAAQNSFKTDFLEYMSSDGAQTLIEGAGYVDQTIELQPISVQGTRLTSAILSAGSGVALELVQKFARDLASADRLSTTFRFTSASSELDSKSQSDVERMVAYLNTEEAGNREILVIGFSDNVGRFDLNERLALLRATSVRDALVAASGGDSLGARIAISAYGPLAPVGCNDSANGRESNRRVEIWMR